MKSSLSHSWVRVAVLLALPCLVMTSGCAALIAAGGTETGVVSAVYSATHVDELKKTAHAVAKTYQDITPEQEYYIGRAVAAAILHRYPALPDEQANHYLNLVGRALVEASDKPETYGGYHFLILNSNEVNAFAAPGGFILVTRGMIRLCTDEDELAAVLAHEIGHVQERHALKSIKADRLTTALSLVAGETLKILGGAKVMLLTKAFEGSVQDITSTLLQRGYSREMERDADEKAVIVLKRVGYDPVALAVLLKTMDEQRSGGVLASFLKTHPSPGDRAQHIETRVGGTTLTPSPSERKRRFTSFLHRV